LIISALILFCASFTFAAVTKDQILLQLRRSVPNWIIERDARSKGLAFSMDESTASELRSRGASESLIRALFDLSRKNQQPTPTLKTGKQSDKTPQLALPTGPDTAFCKDLKSYVRAARTDFQSLKKERIVDDPLAGNDLEWLPLHGISGWEFCQITKYQYSTYTTASCDAMSEDGESMRKSIQSCLVDGWASDALADYAIRFSAKSGVTVDLRHPDSLNKKWTIWISSPDR